MAAKEKRRRRLARSNLLDFVLYTKPDYSINWHHRLICRHLDDFVEGRRRRLMIFMHPRSGKSELVSRRLPAYLLGRFPDAELMACSYSASLAGKMNRDVQRIIDGPAYKRLFPDTTLYGKNIRTMAGGTWIRNSDEFEVVGRKGSYRSAGLGGGIAGRGFHYGIIDDPIKDAASARSDTIRDGQWEWLNSDFFTRQMPNASILITLTRWHFDDIVGRLLRQDEDDLDMIEAGEQAVSSAEGWDILRLPAVAEKDAAHPEDPRKPGDALWPERYPLGFLEARRRRMGVYAFESLYQQNPAPKEGGLFSEAGLSNMADAAPAVVRARVRAYDKGYAAEGDWTVGVLMSRTQEGLFFVEDVARFRLPPHERNRRIEQIAGEDDLRYGKRVPIVIEQPPGAGAETTALLVRELAGHVVRAVRPVGDKSERAEPFAAQCGAGNVRLVRGRWNRAFREELLTFPLGEHDDQADAASTAFNALVTAHTFNVGV